MWSASVALSGQRPHTMKRDPSHRPAARSNTVRRATVLEATPAVSALQQSRATARHRRGQHHQHEGEGDEDGRQRKQVLKEWVEGFVEHITILTSLTRSRVGISKLRAEPQHVAPKRTQEDRAVRVSVVRRAARSGRISNLLRAFTQTHRRRPSDARR